MFMYNISDSPDLNIFSDIKDHKLVTVKRLHANVIYETE